MTAELAQQAKLPQPAGVYIAGIYLHDNASPAATAGVHPGDILMRWNGVEVNSSRELRKHVETTRVGTRAKLILMRDGQELTLEVMVGARPPLPVERRMMVSPTTSRCRHDENASAHSDVPARSLRD
jgi:serine protease DegQ